MTQVHDIGLRLPGAATAGQLSRRTRVCGSRCGQSADALCACVVWKEQTEVVHGRRNIIGFHYIVKCQLIAPLLLCSIPIPTYTVLTLATSDRGS